MEHGGGQEDQAPEDLFVKSYDCETYPPDHYLNPQIRISSQNTNIGKLSSKFNNRLPR